MNNISDLLRSLIDDYSSVDMAESEFKKLLTDNENDLRSKYNEWCEELGYSPKTGYKEYIEEVFENEDSIWDVFDEYGDDKI